MRLNLGNRFELSLLPRQKPQLINTEVLLDRTAKVAIIFTGLIAFIVALDLGKFLVAPVVGAMVVGLMLGPLTTRLERKGVPAPVSALIALALFIVVLIALVGAIIAPARIWAERIPEMWAALKSTATSLRQPLKM
jgi:predicted PurR-regulated permease PerM